MDDGKPWVRARSLFLMLKEASRNSFSEHLRVCPGLGLPWAGN